MVVRAISRSYYTTAGPASIAAAARLNLLTSNRKHCSGAPTTPDIIEKEIRKNFLTYPINLPIGITLKNLALDCSFESISEKGS